MWVYSVALIHWLKEVKRYIQNCSLKSGNNSYASFELLDFFAFRFPNTWGENQGRPTGSFVYPSIHKRMSLEWLCTKIPFVTTWSPMHVLKATSSSKPRHLSRDLQIPVSCESGGLVNTVLALGGDRIEFESYL